MAKMVPVYKAELTKAEAPIREAVTKVGGLPVLLAPVEWPICGECGGRRAWLSVTHRRGPRTPQQPKWPARRSQWVTR